MLKEDRFCATLASCWVSVLVSLGAETISLFVLWKLRLQSSGGIQHMFVEMVKGLSKWNLGSTQTDLEESIYFNMEKED